MATFKGQNPEWSKLIPPEWQDAAWKKGRLPEAMSRSARDPASSTPGAFDYLKSKADPSKSDPKSDSEIRLRQEARKPEPDLANKAPQADKPPEQHTDKQPDKSAPKHAETKPALPPLKVAFAATAGLPHPQPKPETNLAKILNNLGTGGAEGARLRMAKEKRDDNDDNKHEEEKKKEQDLLASLLDAQADEQQRFNEYLDEMIEQTSQLRNELAEEERLSREELRRRALIRDEIFAELTGERKNNKELREALTTIQQVTGQTEESITQRKENVARIEAQKAVVQDQSDENKREGERLKEEQRLAQEKHEIAKKQLEDSIEHTTNIRELQRHMNRSKISTTEQLLLAKEVRDDGRRKVLKDESGNVVYKDKNDRYFFKDAQGNRTHYDEDRQSEFKKRDADGLVTGNEMERREKLVEKLEEQKATEDAGSQNLSDQEAEASNAEQEARQREEGLKTLKEKLDVDVVENASKAQELNAKRTKLEEELDQEKSKLEADRAKLEAQKLTKTQIEEKLQQSTARIAALEEKYTKADDAWLNQSNKVDQLGKDQAYLAKIQDIQEKLKTIPAGPEREKVLKELKDTKEDLSPDIRAKYEKLEQSAQAKMKNKNFVAETQSFTPTSSPAKNETRNENSAAASSVVQEPNKLDTTRSVGTAAATIGNGIVANINTSQQFQMAAQTQTETPPVITELDPAIPPVNRINTSMRLA